MHTLHKFIGKCPNTLDYNLYIFIPVFRFVPRHADELCLETDDPVLMLSRSEDLWCQGYNMRTGATGIFPAFYAVNVAKDISQGELQTTRLYNQIYLHHQQHLMCVSRFLVLFSFLSPERWLCRAVPGAIPGVSSGPHPQGQRCAVCCHAEGT